MLLRTSSFGLKRLLTLGILLFSSGFFNNAANAVVNCTLCQDGSIPEDLDTPVLMDEGKNVTCRDLLEKATIRDTVDACEIIQAEGVSACGCPLPESGGNLNCSLCQDGSSVPDPNLTYVPGFACGSLEEFVKSDERDGACEAYQAVAGVYCGCALNESTSNVCRLCGGTTELADPGLLVPIADVDLAETHAANSTRPCSAVEFDATFFYDECSRYQADYRAACCATTSGSYARKSGAFALRVAAALVSFGVFM